MRALKILTVVMAVMIVAGVVVLGIVISKRMNGPVAAVAPVVAPSVMSAAVLPADLGEPQGTRLAQISAAGDRLVVLLQGGGPDRVVVLGLSNGQVLARMAVSP